MFYDTALADHGPNQGLAFNPFKAIVVPRPIGWISTQDREGRPNLAPYSFFNAVSDAPPMVMFSSHQLKDSARNAHETGVFACNLATYALKDAMNASSAPLPAGVSEFDHAGLTPIPCEKIACPRVAEAPVALECETRQVMELTDETGYFLVIGEVVGVHIDDAFLTDGRLDVTKLTPIARMGYQDYARIDRVFTLSRPE